MTKRRLLICNTLEREVSQLVDSGQHGDVEVVAYPAVCGSDDAEGAALGRVLDRATDSGAPPACVLGCCTLDRVVEHGGRGDRVQLATATRCFDMLLDPELVTLLVEEGAYLVTPGWLTGWRHRLERWGLDRASAPSFFKEVANKIVLLDTGTSPEAEVHLGQFAAFTGLPAERLEVGVDELARFVDRALEPGAASGEGGVAGASEAGADAHAVAARLLLRLMGADTIDEVVAVVLSWFAALCRPARMVLVPGAGGPPYPWPPGAEVDEALLRGSDQRGDVPAMTAGDAGLVVRFEHGDRDVAVLVVEGVAEPACRQAQLALASELLPACAAALSAVMGGETSRAERSEDD